MRPAGRAFACGLAALSGGCSTIDAAPLDDGAPIDAAPAEPSNPIAASTSKLRPAVADDAGVSTAVADAGPPPLVLPWDDICDRDASAGAVEESTFFASAVVENATSIDLPGSGDLWPSCWGDDDATYSAWGDGFGFSPVTGKRPNIGAARIDGDPNDDAGLAGTTLATGSALGQVWTPGPYYQKPTGMCCRDGSLFLAEQDLNSSNYGDAPAATIVTSADHGATWQWDPLHPMFDDHRLTTLFFLDFGKDSADAFDPYAYVYALDFNWRATPDALPLRSPQALYLARALPMDLQNASAWEFFHGLGADGSPTWTSNADDRTPTLIDCALLTPPTGSVISQGGVVYDAPLARYLYTSWGATSWIFYEAPAPWGPWRKFLSYDFGPLPWNETEHGGYATSIPSKFISADGTSMYVQANTWADGAGHNNFALRRLTVVVAQ